MQKHTEDPYGYQEVFKEVYKTVREQEKLSNSSMPNEILINNILYCQKI